MSKKKKKKKKRRRRGRRRRRRRRKKKKKKKKKKSSNTGLTENVIYPIALQLCSITIMFAGNSCGCNISRS